MSARTGHDALILGVGNLLWADEGFGVRCVEQFDRRYRLDDNVEVMDGGTQGLGLVNLLAEARRILIFDAVDFAGAPGDLVVARGEEVPKFAAGNKVSLHQTSMMEMLCLAEFMAGSAPAAITLIGCQPYEMEDYGGGLTAPVAARVDEAVALAVAELKQWGFTAAVRDDATPGVMPAAIDQARYEGERPSAQAACRIGDERVLARFVT